MARPTELARRIAEAIGEPESRVQDRIEAGCYDPVAPLGWPELLDHHRALAKVTGRGRSRDVALIRLAVDGRATVGLRGTLAKIQGLAPGEADTDDADELLAYAVAAPRLAAIHRFLEQRAEAAEVPLAETYQQIGEVGNVPPEPGLPRVRVGAAMLPAALLSLGEKLELEDAQEIGELMAPPGANTDVVQVSTEAAFDSLMLAATVVPNVVDWLNNADDADLVRGVQAADRMIEAMEALGINHEGGEARWRMVGQLAPVALGVLEGLRTMTAALGLSDPSQWPGSYFSALKEFDT